MRFIVNLLGTLTTLGDLLYRSASGLSRLAGNTATTKKFLTQTGSGSASAAPAWDTLVVGDLPSTAFPKRASCFIDETILSSGSWSWNVNGSSNLAGIWFDSALANGVSFTHSVFLAAGTYSFFAAGIGEIDGVKLDWTIDGNSIVSGQDWYKSTTTPSLINPVPGGTDGLPISVTLATSGVHKIVCTVNGRNASNVSNFTIRLLKFWFRPAAD